MANRPVKLKMLPRSTMKVKTATRLVGQVLAGHNTEIAKVSGNFYVTVPEGAVLSYAYLETPLSLNLLNATGMDIPLATTIHAATGKTTPVDADELPLWDSVALALKKLTWANLKATLKTYFDTLYVYTAGNASLTLTANAFSINLANSNTWTAAQNLTLSQDGFTGPTITNASTGTSALAGALYSSGSGRNAGVGIGGPSYTGILLLQNRAYLNGNSSTVGTIINNEGANPLIFGINNLETGRWTAGTRGQLEAGVSATAGGALKLYGATQGSVTLKGAANVAANSIITLPNGTTDFSATGGTSQVVKQTSAGGAFTVATLAASEIASGAALTKTDDTNVTLTLGGAPTSALLAATSITVGWTGTLAVSRGGTGIASFGTGVATFLGTPSSANLASAVTDETGSGSLVFATSPTLTTPVLGVASATSINFGGTALSNYTEGTFTPAVTTDGTVGTPAYTLQQGSYERIGRQVSGRLIILLSGWTGSPTGNVSISGLPLTSANVSNDFGGAMAFSYTVFGLAALSVGIGGVINPNTSAVILKQYSNTAGSAITAAQFGTTALIAMTFQYRV